MDLFYFGDELERDSRPTSIFLAPGAVESNTSSSRESTKQLSCAWVGVAC